MGYIRRNIISETAVKMIFEEAVIRQLSPLDSPVHSLDKVNYDSCVFEPAKR
jgi:hypothetical protein